jgi:hypothetical protein
MFQARAGEFLGFTEWASTHTLQDIGLEFMCSLMTLVSHKNFVMYVNLRNTVVNEPREIVEAHWRDVNIRTSEVDATRILPVYHGDWWSDVEVAPVRWSWVTALRIFSLEVRLRCGPVKTLFLTRIPTS